MAKVPPKGLLIHMDTSLSLVFYRKIAPLLFESGLVLEFLVHIETVNNPIIWNKFP
jgi:hypothetical protein